ncbi:MAG: DUF86 domain-containing protein [Burkholderiaceae bacterium]|nr:MAG: DUF86 domain-containing protein [Burkholderiaceae bacterium]MCC7287677.1 DUF86 domain-containing protein [Burkholderiaceae bacterium]
MAMRNRLVHGYGTVGHALVFNTVTTSFPALADELEQELKRVG